MNVDEFRYRVMASLHFNRREWSASVLLRGSLSRFGEVSEGIEELDRMVAWGILEAVVRRRVRKYRENNNRETTPRCARCGGSTRFRYPHIKGSWMYCGNCDGYTDASTGKYHPFDEGLYEDAMMRVFGSSLTPKQRREHSEYRGRFGKTSITIGGLKSSGKAKGGVKNG